MKKVFSSGIRLLKDNKHLHTFRVMRITTYLLLLFTSFAFAGNTHSQNARVNLNRQQATLKEVLDEIELQTDYLFLSNREVDMERKVNIRAKNKPVKEILDKLFDDTGLTYAMEGVNIVLSKKGALTPSSSSLNQQKKTIKGIITDKSGESIIGANVIEKGTTNGVITDIDGNFSLSVSENAILQITYIGYIEQNIPVGSQTVFNIQLIEDTQILDEVVVIGYGTRQRKSVVGAVDQINSSIIEDRPVANTVQALQGASANLTIQQRNMDPTASGSLNINIRGLTTINNSNDPLVVIDGMITEVGTLTNMNPSDIENVTILKDAGSAAIYGSRSAAGVILVTTKKGAKNNKPVVRFNTLMGIQDPKVLYRPVKGYENAILKNQTLYNVGSAPVFTPEQIRDLQEHGDGEWLLDGILQNALQQNYNFSISGGGQNSTYLVSAGYYNQESNFVGSYGAERYNFRTNLVNEYGRFKMTTVMAYNRGKRTYPSVDANALVADGGRVPNYYYYNMKSDDGRYMLNDILGENNPLGLLEEGGYRKVDEDNILANVNGELKLIEGLTLKGMVDLDLTAHHRLTRVKEVPFYTSEASTIPVYANTRRNTEDLNEKKYILNTQAMLDYDRTFNKVHNVTGLIGVSNESYTFQANELRTDFTDRDLGLPESGTVINTGSYNTPSKHQRRSIYSVFGRAGYAFQDKYYGEFSFRYDGSSKFASGYRWGFFPSVSAGWRLSEESFMGDYNNRVGDLKIRGSYGILGNQNVADYSYFTTYTVRSENMDSNGNNHNYGFNNNMVSTTSFDFGNRELQWEKTATFNIGVDATFFSNRFYVSLDFFNKMTSDILLTPEVPSVFGGSVPRENAGKMKTQGWETTIGFRGNTGAFRHNASFNLGDTWNEVVEFTGGQQISGSGKIIREGEPLSSYFGLKTNGLFQSYEEIANYPLPSGVDRASLALGDVKFVDANGDGVIDNEDRVIYGNGFPRLTFGFNYAVSWKDFDLSFLIQGVGKRDFILRGEQLQPFQGNYGNTMYTHQLDFWTPANTGASRPRLAAEGSQSNNNNWQRTSDLFLLDGAYLRLKNIQIGYTLPRNISSKAGIQKLRISVNAQNLFTLSNTPFFDPETTEFNNNMVVSTGSNYARQYPFIKYYGIGLDVEF